MPRRQNRRTLAAYIEKLKRGPPTPEPERLPEPPTPPPAGFDRRLHKVQPSPREPRPSLSLDEARALIDEEMRAYLDTPNPEHILLVRASPGTGKTTIAVNIAHDVIQTGQRVMYAAPRHDFYLDIQDACRFNERDGALWYEWQPRKERDPETCQHTDAIGRWMRKGYDAINFCSGVCGWDYVNDDCPYHAQKQRREPIIMCQHQHVTLGHPLEFGVVFGDESPLSAFLHRRSIDAGDIVPAGMSREEPFRALLLEVQRIVNSSEPVEGLDWYTTETLGDAGAVADLCDRFAIPLDALVDSGQPHSVEEADRADVWYVHQLAHLLGREARIAADGDDFPHRIIARKGKLDLLMRHAPNEKTPPHVIWMDATGDPRIYRHLFGRPVRTVRAEAALKGNVYQVYDRANGISSMRDVETVTTVADGEERQEQVKIPTDKAEQAARFVSCVSAAREYGRPAVVTFLDIQHLFGKENVANFYGARGTNALADCDAEFVVGGPMPYLVALRRIGAMVFFERDAAFNVQWRAVNREYAGYIDADGLARAYPVGGFWGDPDLEAIVRVYREDEILQSAHRSRPILSPVDVWLVTNIPVEELPPTRLVSMRETLGAPPGVNLWKWLDFVDAIENIQVVTTKIITEECDIDCRTVRKYFGLLVESGEWREYDKEIDGDIIARAGPGRPPKTLVRR